MSYNDGIACADLLGINDTRLHFYGKEALLHMDSICRIGEGEGEGFLEIYVTFGRFYAESDRLDDAERMYDRALAGYQKESGADHTSTLDTVHSLGKLYRSQGRLVDAETMYERALAGKEKVLGADHSSTLDTVHNLRLLYVNQGRLADAEKILDRALAGREMALGADHSSTLDTVHSLGVLYVDQGRLADAKRMYERALTRYKSALGANHTSTLTRFPHCHQQEYTKVPITCVIRSLNEQFAGVDETVSEQWMSNLIQHHRPRFCNGRHLEK